MKPSNVILVIGNGISIDLRNHFFEELGHLDSSSPLGWNLRHPELGNDLKGLFPRAFSALENTTGTDFEKMQELLMREGALDALPVLEIRHYLVMAYSLYQRQVDRLPLQNWRWAKFFRDYREIICGMVSFNYDLVAERVAARAGMRILSVGMPEPLRQPLDGLRHYDMYVWKPHGSINYRPDARSIVTETSYPLPHQIYDNDLPLEWCPARQWTTPRVEADLVIPTEASRYRQFQWVAPGENWARSTGGLRDACVIVGMSYAECDREEVDLILESISRKAQFVVVDPNPSNSLLDKLSNMKVSVTCLDSPPVWN